MTMEMSWEIKIACILVSLAFLFLVVEMVRRKSLRESYSLLWMGAGSLLLLISLWNSLLYVVARKLKVADDNSLLFAGGFVFVIVMLLHVSVELTRLRRETKELAQFLALTDWRARKALKSGEDGTESEAGNA